MKAKKAIALFCAAALGLSTLAGCGGGGVEKGLTDAAPQGDYLADFSAGDPGSKVLFASAGYTNGGVFNTQWDGSQLTYSDGQMHLGLAENSAGSLEERTQWLGGEARTAYYYGYGDYEVRMKPSTSVGTASTFFVCTGNYDVWPDGTQNPWDEIDIEFLGKDTTKVQFNYFANGTGGHEHMYDLGFNASEEFHNYGFRWAENYITWFVDGKPVYRVNKENVKAGESFPKTAGRILMNYWAGAPGTGENTAEDWMGRFSGPDGKTADYQWVKTSAKRQAPPTGDPYAPAKGDAYEGDWDKETAAELTFADAEEYKVTLSGDKKSADITYTDVAGNSYHNIGTNVAVAAAGHGFAQLTVKNNGSKPVNLRVNVQDAQNKAINAAASQDGEKVNTDLVYGGSFFVIEAGKTAVCEVKYVGVAAEIQLMIDSATNKADKSSGSITVSGLKFAGEGTQPPKTDVIEWGAVEAQQLGFADSDPFTVVLSEDKLSADITYTAAQGATYTNVEMPAPAAAAGTDLAHFKIKNNGEAEVYLRISLINNEKDAENAASGYTKNSDVNVSATMNGVTVETNLTNGGSFFTIPAGAEAECVIKFEGAVDRIQLMPDTSKWGDTATHAGNLHVSELKFTKGGEGEGGETPDLPAADNKGVTVNGAKLAVAGNTDDYIVISDEAANTIRVVYADLAGETYKNLWMDATAIARTKNVFTVKVTNNGTEKLTFRVDIESVTAHGSNNIVACNQSAKQDGADAWTDLEWGGSKFEIEAGKTAVCAVTYDTSMGPTNVKMYFDSCINADTAKHSGDVTLAEMAFTGEGTYTPAEPEQPDVPAGEPAALTFNAEANSGYTMTAGEENKSWTLAYQGLGNTYKPVTAACADLAAGKNTFTITIKNNKDTAVTVRVDVQGTTRVDTSNNDGSGSGTDCTNVSATSTGGTGLYTDTTWGGTKVTLAAGEEVTLVITYNEAMAQGAVKNILIFVDSMGGDTNEHDASVTVSGFLFSDEE